MINVNQQNYNINFCRRNKEIKEAQKILHKIKSDFPASSSYIADLLAEKREIRLKNPNFQINLSDLLEQYYKSNNIGAKKTNNNVAKLRMVQKHFLNEDYKYCDSLVWGIKKLRAMNCKENSELAFLISVINGYKNCHCINLAKQLPDSTFADLEHTVLLINQELPDNIAKLDKFYDQNVDNASAFIPSPKSIVIDPIFGIVDYWNNALLDYKTIFPQMADVKNLWAGARKEIIKTPNDIKEFKNSHPEFIINPQVQINKPNLFNQVIKYFWEKTK